MFTARALLGAIVIACSASAVAQTGGIPDAAVKPLSQAEARAILSGSVYKGSDAGRRWEYTVEKEGRAFGVYSYRYISPVSGTWTVEESGRVCFALQGSSSRPFVSIQQCQFVFKVGDAYFGGVYRGYEPLLTSIVAPLK